MDGYALHSTISDLLQYLRGARATLEEVRGGHANILPASAVAQADGQLAILEGYFQSVDDKARELWLDETS